MIQHNDRRRTDLTLAVYADGKNVVRVTADT